MIYASESQGGKGVSVLAAAASAARADAASAAPADAASAASADGCFHGADLNHGLTLAEFVGAAIPFKVNNCLSSV